METKNSKRVIHTHEVDINAAAQNIFPLACPVEELKWIEGWGDQHEMMYTESGVNEKHCIFKEKMSGPILIEKPVMTHWITVIHDPFNHRIEFLLMVGENAVINFQFGITENGENLSRCRWSFIFTALDEKTNAIPEDIIEERLKVITEGLSSMLKHYCEAGRMMRMVNGEADI